MLWYLEERSSIDCTNFQNVRAESGGYNSVRKS